MVITVQQIHDIIEQNRGERVFYHASNGRRKAKDSAAIIQDAYPSLFTLFIEDTNSTISFRYTDLLTRDVTLVYEESGEQLV